MLEDTPVLSPEMLEDYLKNHQFKVVKKLSDGTNNYGDVLLVRNDANVDYALKIIHKSKFHKGDFEIAAKLKHVYIMQTYSMEEIGDFAFVISEFIKDGSLKGYIKSQQKQKLPPNPEIATEIISQILTAVDYLHYGYAKKVIHRDLKSDNILLLGVPTPGKPNVNTIIKVCDFGLAREIKVTLATTQCGTAGYKAPEVQLMSTFGGKYDEKVDTWSIGVILYEMSTFRLPFTNMGLLPQDIRKAIPRPKTMAGPEWDFIWRLIIGLLQIQPEKRLSCKEALKILEEGGVKITVPPPMSSGPVLAPAAAAPPPTPAAAPPAASPPATAPPAASPPAASPPAAAPPAASPPAVSAATSSSSSSSSSSGPVPFAPSFSFSRSQVTKPTPSATCVNDYTRPSGPAASPPSVAAGGNLRPSGVIASNVAAASSPASTPAASAPAPAPAPAASGGTQPSQTVNLADLKPHERFQQLPDSEFQALFKVTRDQFTKLPQWKQNNLRKANNLF